MLRQIFFFGLLFFGTLLWGEDCSESDCKWAIYDFRAALSHREGRGIGYRRGYTTVETFLMPSLLEQCAVYPFIDLRGHGFNDGKRAANAGVGIRYLDPCCWVYGTNVYFDYRQSHHQGFDRVSHAFQQLGVGLEALGPNWDFRMNYYQPLGIKVWHFVQTVFHDNKGITPINSKRRQYTVRMIDAEIGTCAGSGSFCDGCIDWSVYFAAGPYYLRERCTSGRCGGKARLAATLNNFLLEVFTSYDRITHGTLQIKIGIDFDLYAQSPSTNRYCCDLNDSCFGFVYDRLSQPVQRQEIIPLGK